MLVRSDHREHVILDLRRRCIREGLPMVPTASVGGTRRQNARSEHPGGGTGNGSLSGKRQETRMDLYENPSRNFP